MYTGFILKPAFHSKTHYGSVADLKKMSAISGLVFGAFLVLHLISHYMNVGLEVVQTTLTKFRTPYQNPPICEFVVGLVALTRIQANCSLYFVSSKIKAKNKNEAGGKEPKGKTERSAQRIAGYILGFATRLGALIFLDDASAFDYKYVGTAYSLAPLSSFPIYLCIIGVAGGWHVVYGSYSAEATLSGSSVIGKAMPLPLKVMTTLKVMTMMSNVAVVSTVLSLGYYVQSIERKRPPGILPQDGNIMARQREACY